MRHRRWLVVLTLLILAHPAALLGLVRLALPDAPAPAGLARPIAEFGSTLASQLDRPLTHARFMRAETGPDRLTILFFELRSYPFVLPGELAYLVSRCTPPEALDPWGMGGGIVQGDPATDYELEYLRSDAQPPCPAGAPAGRTDGSAEPTLGRQRPHLPRMLTGRALETIGPREASA